jgi:hypothetical protein
MFCWIDGTHARVRLLLEHQALPASFLFAYFFLSDRQMTGARTCARWGARQHCDEQAECVASAPAGRAMIGGQRPRSDSVRVERARQCITFF